MKVKIKKLVETAIIPKYAKPGDAGMDLTATSYYYDATNDNYVYGTGLAVEIPEGFVGLVFPRSSNRKTFHYLTNHVGVIDSGYRGEIILTFKHRDDIFNSERPYNVGDRIGQLIIMPYPTIEFVESDELSETERGTGGHGSTGN
jgi:dUTP pyrophosphatase